MAKLKKDTKKRIVISLTDEVAGKDLIDAIEGSRVLSGNGVPANTLGDNGDVYVNLLNGDIYAKANGVWVGGQGQVLSGNGAPNNALGDNGDLYLNLTNGDLYKKFNNAWALQASGGTGVEAAFEDIEEPVGFKDASKATLSIDDASRTLTITPVGSYVCFVAGKRLEINTVKTANWTNSHGLHFFYIDQNGTLQTTTTFTDELITRYTFVSVLYWDQAAARHIYWANEKHGIHMGTFTHLYLHTTRGAQFDNGLKLVNFVVDGSGNLASHAQFTSNLGVIWDEDIKISIPAQTTFPIMYRLGTVWKRKEADSYPLIYSGTAGYTGANGRPAYNRFDGTNWSLTQVDQNKWVLVHLFATNDIEHPIMGIQGIQEYNSKAAARQGAYNEIQSLTGLPFAEFAPIGSVIFETSNSYTNVPKARVVSTDTGADYVDHRSVYFRPNAF